MKRSQVLDLVDTSGNVATTILVPSAATTVSWNFQHAPIMLGRIVLRTIEEDRDD